MAAGRNLGATLLAIGLLLAGCGMESPVSELPPTPSPTLQPVSPPASPNDDAREIVEWVRRQSAATQNWTANARTEVSGPGTKRDYNVSRVSFKRPGTTAAVLKGSANGKKIGTKLIYNDREVAIRTYFFGIIPIKLTLPITDERLLDAYGRSLRDTSTDQIMAVILDPRSQARRVGSFRLGNEDLELLEFRSPVSWKDVSREVIGISRRTGLPIYRDCYDKQNRRIFHVELHDMRTNVGFGSKEFTLD